MLIVHLVGRGRVHQHQRRAGDFHVGLHFVYVCVCLIRYSGTVMSLCGHTMWLPLRRGTYSLGLHLVCILLLSLIKRSTPKNYAKAIWAKLELVCVLAARNLLHTSQLLMLCTPHPIPHHPEPSLHAALNICLSGASNLCCRCVLFAF